MRTDHILSLHGVCKWLNNKSEVQVESVLGKRVELKEGERRLNFSALSSQPSPKIINIAKEKGVGIISLEDLSGKISVVQEFLDLPIRSHMCPGRHHNLTINSQFRWDYLNRSRSYSLGSSCYSRERR